MRYNFCIIYIDVGSPFQTYMNVVLVIIMLVTFIFFHFINLSALNT